MRPVVGSLLALVVFLSGCTFSSVQRLSTMDPSQTLNPSQPTTHWIVLGPVTMPPRDEEAPYKPSWDQHLPHFERGFREWIQRNGRGEWAVVDGSVALPADVPHLKVTGQIYRFVRGVEALRFWVGMGAGQARVGGDFEIKDQSGVTLARFRARESYLGGFGIGGIGVPLLNGFPLPMPDFLSLETLVRRFAETAAEEVVKWGDHNPQFGRSAASHGGPALAER